jgi:hypothetical protein
MSSSEESEEYERSIEKPAPASPHSVDVERGAREDPYRVMGENFINEAVAVAGGDVGFSQFSSEDFTKPVSEAEITRNLQLSRELVSALREMIDEARLHAESVQLLEQATGVESPQAAIAELPIEFSETCTVRELIEKLTILQEIYHIACDIAGISSRRIPLVLKKLETGSTIAAFVGSKEGFSIFKWMADKAFSVYGRSRSRKAAIGDAKGIIEAVTEMTKARKELVDMGLKPEKVADDSLQDAFTYAAVKLRDLAKGQRSVSFAGQKYEIRAEVRRRQLGDRQQAEFERSFPTSAPQKEGTKPPQETEQPRRPRQSPRKKSRRKR